MVISFVEQMVAVSINILVNGALRFANSTLQRFIAGYVVISGGVKE